MQSNLDSKEERNRVLIRNLAQPDKPNGPALIEAKIRDSSI